MVFHSDQSVVEEGVIIDDFFVDGTLSTQDFSINDVLIYPNPSNNIFNIKLNNTGEFIFSVTDLMGKIVIEENRISQTNYALDMSGYASG